jgi:nucleotide-binding universal stress UspA family protein
LRGSKTNAAVAVKSAPKSLVADLHLSRVSSSLSIRMGDEAKRTYLVVVDDSAESRVALRFAARRAGKTNGSIEVLGIVEPQDFVQFGGVQAAMEEEQQLRIEGVVSSAIGEILDESGIQANIIIRQGEVVKSVRDYVAGRDEIAALVLGAAPTGHPGQLVSSFAGNDAGLLPCPVMIIPGSLTDERLEQLS